MIIGRFCCTLELIELRLKMLIRCARFLIRNIHTENTYELCFIRRPVRMRRPPNLLFRAKKKSSTDSFVVASSIKNGSWWSLFWTFLSDILVQVSLSRSRSLLPVLFSMDASASPSGSPSGSRSPVTTESRGDASE